jgi:hypothetical protein
LIFDHIRNDDLVPCLYIDIDVKSLAALFLEENPNKLWNVIKGLNAQKTIDGDMRSATVTTNELKESHSRSASYRYMCPWISLTNPKVSQRFKELRGELREIGLAAPTECDHSTKAILMVVPTLTVPLGTSQSKERASASPAVEDGIATAIVI